MSVSDTSRRKGEVLTCGPRLSESEKVRVGVLPTELGCGRSWDGAQVTKEEGESIGPGAVGPCGRGEGGLRLGQWAE